MVPLAFVRRRRAPEERRMDSGSHPSPLPALDVTFLHLTTYSDSSWVPWSSSAFSVPCCSPSTFDTCLAELDPCLASRQVTKIGIPLVSHPCPACSCTKPRCLRAGIPSGQCTPQNPLRISVDEMTNVEAGQSAGNESSRRDLSVRARPYALF